MSLRYRDANGAETVLAGLTPGGNLEAGAVATRKGTITYNSAIAQGAYDYTTVTFDTPMPDANYEVIITASSGGHGEHVNAGAFHVWDKAASGFKFSIAAPTNNITSGWTAYYTAWKIYEVAEAERLYSELQTLQNMVPSNASSTNQFSTKDDLRTEARALDRRLDDVEDVIPLNATVSNQLATKNDVDTVADDTETRLKVVDTIPSTPQDGDVLLYVGTESGFRKGGVYQYAATPGAWVLISTADVDLSHYETSFTGTTAQWNALSSIEKDKYDLVNLTDDNEREIGENFSTNEQRVGSWIDGKPIYKITFTMSNPASSTAPSTHAEISVTKNVSSWHIDKIIKWDATTTWPSSVGTNTDSYYFPSDVTVTSDIISSVSGTSATGTTNNYTRQFFTKSSNTFGLAKSGRYYNYGITSYNTIYYTKTTD